MTERQRLSSESPLLQALENAPFDDEPLTAEEEAALNEAESDLAEGRLISHSDARHHLLTLSLLTHPPHRFK